jgi:hypothetical protein
MPEQPQWSERTLDMPPQDPWADQPTRQTTPEGAVDTPAPTSPGPAPAPDSSPFSRGRAQVTQRTEQFRAEHEPTGTGWPGDHHHEQRQQRSLSWHMRRLRRGGEWSGAAALFAFVCWGIWALSSGADLTNPLILFIVELIVAAGVFALSRLVGRLVIEQRMGRPRHTARGAHVVAGLFLVGVGLAHLQQTDWVMSAVGWVTGLFS